MVGLASKEGNHQYRPVCVTFSMILTGVCRTFTAKVLIQLGFDSPYLLTCGMSLGMFLCSFALLPTIVMDLLVKWKRSAETGRQKYSALRANETGQDCETDSASTSLPAAPISESLGISWRAVIGVVLSGLCDLSGTGLNFIALLWLPAAVNEVIRSGTELIATALIMVCFHGQIVTRLGWSSIATSSVGLMLVSGGLFLSTSELGPNAVIGILISIPRALISATQNYLDQQLVKSLNLTPIVVVGLEGLVGLCILLPLWPLVQHLGLEDVKFHANVLFNGSHELLPVYGIFLLMVSISNYFNVSMVAVTDALTKEIWRAMRPPIIWVFSMIIFYCGSHQVGERWDSQEGYSRLLGILLVTAGIIGYTYQANKLKEALKTAVDEIPESAAVASTDGDIEGDVELSSS
jgi:drug/metabolite transporter (DMT)-like permease